MESLDNGRRRQVRLRVHNLTLLFRKSGIVQVVLFFKNPDKKGMVIDCSDGGLQILAAEPIERNTPLTLRMHPAFLSIEIVLKGKVAYCHRRISPKGAVSHQLGITLLKPCKDYLQMVKRLSEDPMLRQGAL